MRRAFWIVARGAFGRPWSFLLLGLALAGPAAAACPSPSTAPQTVKYVIDGDTLVLADARHVRVLGINAPEIRHGKQPAQRFGPEARDALRALVEAAGDRLQLGFDTSRRDRYGRTLAYLFSPTGTDLGKQLLNQGLAYLVAIPPNDAHRACYAAAEAAARRANRGLWNKTAPQAAAGLTRHHGFVLLRGRVTDLHETRQGHLVIELDRQVELFVRQRNRRRIGLASPPPVSSLLEARGWLYDYHGRPNLELRDAAMWRQVDSPD